MIEDPLDCIFGQGEASMEVPKSDNGAVGRRRLRAHKRAHRRLRARHGETNTSDASYDG